MNVLCTYEIRYLLALPYQKMRSLTQDVGFCVKNIFYVVLVYAPSTPLSEFTLVYFPHKSVKGQALADFLANHPSLQIRTEQSVELGIYGAKKEPWILKFDGSSIENSV